MSIIQPSRSHAVIVLSSSAFQEVRLGLIASGLAGRILPAHGADGRDIIELNDPITMVERETVEQPAMCLTPVSLASFEDLVDELFRRFPQAAIIVRDEKDRKQAYRWHGDHATVVGMLEYLKVDIVNDWAEQANPMDPEDL